jgi:alkylation response protein AidB-like acyl-CoA dehydrogenase
VGGAAPAIELAEIMLSFGRVSGAARTLEEYVAALPQESARPWIRLLHLYRRNGMRKEFEALVGGQGLPKVIHAACIEMVNSANLSFALCPLLTDGAIEALLTAGSKEQQNAYIPKMISGKWTGTMDLTEPQAGSDLALVRTRAEPQEDGSYKLFGTKIFITYGEHDMADNIVHLVLGRVTGAPEGIKGISLFIAPKFLADGSRNDLHCVSIEHKLGIKASPTAVLQYGDNGGAVGYLVGQANRGLEYMFIMMNAARYAVGMQGIALAERAYQKAVGYSRDRVQVSRWRSMPSPRRVNGSSPTTARMSARRLPAPCLS